MNKSMKASQTAARQQELTIEQKEVLRKRDYKQARANVAQELIKSMIMAGDGDGDPETLCRAAFDLAEEFILQADKREVPDLDAVYGKVQ